MARITLLALSAVFALSSAEALAPNNRHAMITAGVSVNQLLSGQFMPLRRQLQCEQATDTPCADGTGCCPYGDACTYVTQDGSEYPACGGTCSFNANPCGPAGLCCDANETCDSDGLCGLVSATGGITIPPVSTVQFPTTTDYSFSSETPDTTPLTSRTTRPVPTSFIDSSSESVETPTRVTTTSRSSSNAGFPSQITESSESSSESASTPTGANAASAMSGAGWTWLSLLLAMGGL